MSRKVKIRSLNGVYKIAAFSSCPRKDDRGVYKVGLDHLPEEYKNSPYIVKPTDRPPITHNMTLDLSIEEHVCLYHYFLDVPEVANTLREFNPGKHLFYIEDAEKEAANAVVNDERMLEAFSLISQHSDSESFKNILYFNRSNPEGLSPVMLKQHVYKLCKKEPVTVIEAFSKEAKYSVLLHKALFKGVVKKMKNSYYFGDILLGVGVNAAIEYLINPEYAKVVSEIGSAALGVKPSGEQKAEIVFNDGSKRLCNEEEVDRLLEQNNLKVNSMYKLNGKAKKLNAYYQTLVEMNIKN